MKWHRMMHNILSKEWMSGMIIRTFCRNSAGLKYDGEIDIGLTCGNSIGKNMLKF
jgi:hypothetical protein